MFDNSTTEDLLVSGTYVILTALIIPVYFLLLYIFLTDKDFKKIGSYKLFVNLGFFDCLQLCFHWTAGVLVLSPQICDEGPYICWFLGASLNSAWVGLFPATVVIAAQRLYIVVHRINSDFALPLPLRVFLVIGWIYTALFYAGLLFFGTVTFYPADYSWGYGEDAASSLMENIEYFVSIASIIISFILYLLVIWEIVYLKKLKHSSSPRTNNQEKRILIQSLILFCNLTLLISAWHHYDLVAPPTKETYFVINSYWILYCGLNPFLYLTMNSKIRQKFIAILCCRKPKTIVPDIILTTTTNHSRASTRR